MMGRAGQKEKGRSAPGNIGQGARPLVAGPPRSGHEPPARTLPAAGSPPPATAGSARASPRAPSSETVTRPERSADSTSHSAAGPRSPRPASRRLPAAVRHPSARQSEHRTRDRTSTTDARRAGPARGDAAHRNRPARSPRSPTNRSLPTRSGTRPGWPPTSCPGAPVGGRRLPPAASPCSHAPTPSSLQGSAPRSRARGV